ncbi:hypothetical protein J4Q44_G00367050 [Coregonus suidteri]|uniref:Uncharacterized protein n=1 Tax=Coregonus suidteri TaxID=861788 RepID=A0AAN8KP53_9TELE
MLKTKPSALAGTGSENSAAVELKSGQRRWGQTVLKATDSWDESEPSDTSVSYSKKPSLGSEEEKGHKDRSDLQSKEQKTTYSFSTVTKLPSNINMGQMDSSLPGSSARQHYLSQSRYLPGLIGKNSIDKEPSGPTLQDLWEHSTKVNSRPLGAHWSWFIRHQSQRRKHCQYKVQSGWRLYSLLSEERGWLCGSKDPACSSCRPAHKT